MLKSFGYAFQGIKDALASEDNLKVHFGVAIIAVILALFFKFSPIEWAILATTIFVVITLELINTTIEKLTDIISPEKSEKARIVKDISAAVVLTGAILSIIVGLLLFVPKAMSLF